jgi:hypothetical protein
MNRAACVAACAVFLVGCESMVAPRYSVTGDNNMAIRALSTNGIGVGEFRGPRLFDPNCRMLGPLEVADGLTHTQYIRRGFEEEFKVGGIYSAAPRIVLTGYVNRMEFSSARNITGGNWTIELILASSNGMTMKAEESYDFTSGFIANTACKQTAEAFAPAVQNLIGKFLRSPDFAMMLRSDRTFIPTHSMKPPPRGEEQIQGQGQGRSGGGRGRGQVRSGRQRSDDPAPD